MQEPKFTAEGGTYLAACDLINALAAVGITASITTGGVSIWATTGTYKTMRNVCAVAGFRCLPGTGTMAAIKLGESPAGRQIVAAAIDAAIILTAPMPDA